MNHWDMQKKPLVVGLQWGESHAAFLKSSVSLAQRLGSCIEAVHCLEEPFAFLHESAGEMQVFRFLKDLVERTAKQVDLHVHIEKGQPAEDLCRIAREVGAGMILCGLRNHSKTRTFKGLSTAMSLAFYAPVPVLILPLEASIDFERSVNILFCDTLGGSGWQLLTTGLQFAHALNTQGLFHAHILKTSGYPVANAPTDGPEEALVSRIKDELLYRFNSTPFAAEWKGRYHRLAAVGDLDDEIIDMIDTSQCQVIIIGREQFLEGRNIALDRIPYRALMERKIGLLVLPDYRPSLLSRARVGHSQAEELEDGRVMH